MRSVARVIACAVLCSAGCGKGPGGSDAAPIDGISVGIRAERIPVEGVRIGDAPADGALADGAGSGRSDAAGADAAGHMADAAAPDAATHMVDAAPIDAAGHMADAALVDGAVHVPGMPSAGAHGLSFFRVGQATTAMIATPPMMTQSTGSTIVVGVGRGNNLVFNNAAAVPTDNMGNGPYQPQGQAEPYVHPNEFSGTALYALTSARGGPGFEISALAGTATNGNHDEVTIAAVEVVGGSRIADFVWSEVVQPATPVPVTSKAVTTTGPATLVAFWWGDGAEPNGGHIAVNNGFQVVDSIQDSGSLVQGAVAVKSVAAAGTYDITWTADPVQGAQLWLIAVQ